MTRLLTRLFVLSVLLAGVTIAVVAGCASSARPREPQAPTAERGELVTAQNEEELKKLPPVTPPPAVAESPLTTVTGGKRYSQSLQDGADAPFGVPGAQAAADELWVIEKGKSQRTETEYFRQLERRHLAESLTPATQPTATGRPMQQMAQRKTVQESAEDLDPGTGQLVAKLPDQKLVPVPLKHTDVKGSIAGYIATVDVTQQYHNPYAEKIEAVYVFPLPTNAAVNGFVMTIGERRIRGIIREREEAKQIYENAKRQGYVASLMSQERPNVFTQSVANIEPGKQIDVNVKYFHTLEYVDGWYEYVFPMVVGPRFNPPGSTDGIGAKPHDSPPGATGQATEVSYLKPNERNGHDISLALDIDAGVKVEEIKSINHEVKLDRADEARAKVTLASSDSIPNKDFVLRYKVAGKTVKSALMAQKDTKNGGGYFSLMLFPPESLNDLPRKPLELVFTLDVSGSMSGQPIAQSKSAIKYAVTHMRPDDTFNVIRFAGQAEQMAPRAVPATEENMQQGLKYMESMEAGGGTMMIEGIRRSLQVTPDPERLRFVAFLTDGYIGNEREILGEIHNLRGPSRIFSFGVGSSTNRYLLDHMARLGQGCAAYLSLNEDGAKVMADYFERISHPALTDIAIDWGQMTVTETYPAKMPDLFVGRPVVITGRYSGDPAAATVKVRGKVGGETREIALKVNAADATSQHAGIAPVWARSKIADLGDRATYESANADLTGDIKQVALEYGLMSAYTSFIAVDSTARTAGEHGTTVAVPVPVPQGVKYETTVPEQ